MNAIQRWLADRGWRAFAYQKRVWQAYADGHSGLVHAPTGTGKSYAVWLGILQDWLRRHARRDRWPKAAVPLSVVWVTPMRALANDLVGTLEAPLVATRMPWTVDMRTGDTSTAARTRQRRQMPSALVTTPESLSLLLSYPAARDMFGSLECVVVDEWHELLGTKRGVQAELALARLRAWLPRLRTWGLSATLGNLDEALAVLMGCRAADEPARLTVGRTPATVGRTRLAVGRTFLSASVPEETDKNVRPTVDARRGACHRAGLIIEGDQQKTIAIDTIIPDDIERFPWSGHLGLKLLPRVVEAIDQARTTLLFTNVRSQAEIWFQALLAARRDWAAELALHHGSLDREIRDYVEGRLRRGDIRCVVSTSSLDLGVDFSPVDQVIQIGSPKGIARLLQRAGRSGHQPGAVSRIVCVPTHAFELVEYAAVREAAAARALEGREALDRPLDVLVQHLVTVAASEPFDEQALFDEVRTAYAFRSLSRAEWQWALDFVTRGGPALRAYTQYARLAPSEGRYRTASAQITRMHRMSIGTITGDTSVLVRMLGGRTLGTIEESFIARIRSGETFVFAGKSLRLVLWKEMTAYVRRSSDRSRLVPRWDGSKLPLSTQLAAAMRRRLTLARDGQFDSPEMQAVRPILELQAAWSRIPRSDELLVEYTRTREGCQAFVYPFEGRLVHEGLASLAAYRLTRRAPRSLTITVNDYGFELLSHEPLDLDADAWRELLSRDNLLDDLLACLNTAELARRRFREVARVAGLVFPGYPGAAKSARQLQASSGLLFDVFSEYDPANLLLDQARREVLAEQLEAARLTAALARIERLAIAVEAPERMTPLGFPLWAARIQTTHMTSERWSDRVARMAVRLEKAASNDKPSRKRRARDRVPG